MAATTVRSAKEFESRLERYLFERSEEWRAVRVGEKEVSEQAEIVRRYAEITGFDLADLAWYRAFAYFKLAVVCQGVAARAAGGAMLGSGFEQAQAIVEPLVRAGHHVLAGAG